MDIPNIPKYPIIHIDASRLLLKYSTSLDFFPPIDIPHQSRLSGDTRFPLQNTLLHVNVYGEVDPLSILER